ncbi:nitrate- and nitrite sensing domain-containing protein [Streptosporangium lutulentum]|uniref:histidine kinase n=1 Tax=Streptosporangium lutulentum TaxID=1461250 RepID=A0ABT9QH95_9ACTN|nr:nitrate- and nitrite sensing domain-containing protein [Streptosporangium lutulentum]MDP9846067.1 signal transduction histidine kinase [Streptosporangium lutulentum]
MRSRLVALILVPTVAAVLLGGVQVFASMSAATDYQRVNDLARLSGNVGALTHELAAERDHMAWFIALGRPDDGVDGVNDRMDAVDDAAKHVRDGGALLKDTLSGRAGDEVETGLTRLDDLAPLRERALKSGLLPDAAVDAYSLMIADLLSLHDELGKGSADDALLGKALTLDALVRAKEALSLQRALLTVVMVAGRFEQRQMEAFLGALSTERNERRTLAADAEGEDRRLFEETVNGTTAGRAELLRELVLLRAASGASLKGLDPAKEDDAREWFDAASVTIDRMREVEKRYAQDIVVRSEELGNAEQIRALLVAAAVAGLLLIVLLITTGVVRSLVGPLRRLRSEALEVAGERLPAYVQQVRESRDGEVVADVPSIGVTSRDEIGEVARAFDEVHREAVRLASDEARLRNTVNAMFVNLSRRSQTLVERQLTLVERLERGERDDQRLADLFKLDHLATRMRRNSENLLVLAGQEVVRRWRQPVELMDVVRASLSEVEDYERVVTRVNSEVAVAGPAVSDVVHLLAELVENAVSFSSREHEVVVSSSRIDGGGVMISVSDQGIGMTPDELSQANRRLADPQTADASVARRMGLFVVGRLALKHGIRVQLRPQETGLNAMIVLPEHLLAPLPASVPVPDAVPAGFGGPSRAGSVLAAPFAPETPAVPARTWPPAMEEPSVWNPPAEREGNRFLQPPPGPFDRRPSPPEVNGLGPAPKAGTSPPDPETDFLPIFASVESAWFRAATPGSAETPAEGPDRAASAKSGAAPGSWSSPGDPGWRAAQAASAPALGGTTTSGLPKRTPKGNLVPGSVSPGAQSPPPAASVSAEKVRDRLASFQEGVRKARNELPNRET